MPAVRRSYQSLLQEITELYTQTRLPAVGRAGRGECGAIWYEISYNFINISKL